MHFNRIYSGIGIGPRTWSFETQSDEQLLIISGSAWTQRQNTDLTIDVIVNAMKVGEMLIHSNGTRTHRAFVTLTLPLRLSETTPPNQHTLELRPNGDVIIDRHDYFDILVIDA